MDYVRLQLGCWLIVVYIMIVYYRDRRRFHLHRRVKLFDVLLLIALVNLTLDAVTAYTINHLDLLSPALNLALHGAFLLSIDTLIFALFLYLLSATEGLPRSRLTRLFLHLPYFANVVGVLWFLPELEYRHGPLGNYPAGLSAYGCFVMAGVYTLFTLGMVLTRWHYIQRYKRFNILTGLAVLIAVSTYQVVEPDSLISGIGAAIMVLGAYMNQEDPAILELDRYQSEMVTGFSNLIESRDESTGGHVKRTTQYVELLAKGLRRRGIYREVLTKDYMRRLLMAAPMHDIGKIAIPDAILQKPGRLTPEEFAQMQQHTVQGAAIISQSFGHMGDGQYLELAREIALHHHEKWNGKGYPNSLFRREIPLCARIMAIADVFDAVSENRCYRAALPMEQCFDIIAQGRGQDFDPILVDVFLDLREQVEAICRQHR